MLTFHSASPRIIDSRRAIADCLQAASADGSIEIDLLVIHASIGHDFQLLAEEAARLAPGARVLGAWCCGVVGTEGVSEAMKDIAVMAIRGKEFAVAHVDGIYAHTSWQIFDQEVFEHSAWMIGFAAPSLSVETQASHGHYPTGIEEGTSLWLTVRDEARIFKDLSRMMDHLVSRTAGAGIAAVFHADCLARGRHTLPRILKEELVAGMQEPPSESGRIPPWLGMYGFGEFARLGGRNTYHN